MGPGLVRYGLASQALGPGGRAGEVGHRCVAENAVRMDRLYGLPEQARQRQVGWRVRFWGRLLFFCAKGGLDVPPSP